MAGTTTTYTGPDATVMEYEFVPALPAVLPASDGAPAAFVAQEEEEKGEEKAGEEGKEGETVLERRERIVAAARAARETSQAIHGTAEWDGLFVDVDGRGPEPTPEKIAELLAVAAATAARTVAWGVAETERRKKEDEETERMKEEMKEYKGERREDKGV